MTDLRSHVHLSHPRSRPLALADSAPPDPGQVLGGSLEQRMDRFAARWSLTATEVRVLTMLVQGEANKDIARSLRVSFRTVEQHTANLLRKTGSDSRVRLIARFWSER